MLAGATTGADRAHRHAARRAWLAAGLILALMLLGGGYVLWSHPDPRALGMPAPESTLSATGRNSYVVLEPGRRWAYSGAGARELVVTVLDRTLLIDGAQTRVVEERETDAGKLVEKSDVYYAIDSVSHDVYDFGEDVDDYSSGRLDHGGSWRAGEAGAHFGLMMPARPRVGLRHQQQIAPGVAQDRGEIVSVTATESTPAGMWHDCVEVVENDPAQPGVTEYKFYAPGVGLVRDADFVLVSYGLGR